MLVAVGIRLSHARGVLESIVQIPSMGRHLNASWVATFAGAAALCGILFPCRGVFAEQVRVRYTEGLSRGFMMMHTQSGVSIAQGETTQTASNGRVTSHLVFHFKDGSVYDDTTTFTDRGMFRLLSDHLIEKGPSFKMPTDTSIDTSTGMVSVSYSEGVKTKTIHQKMDLPVDLANGMIFAIVKNIRSRPVTSVSYLATAPKPQLIKLVFTQEGRENFTIGSSTEPAIHYVMKVDIGGIKGAIAKL